MQVPLTVSFKEMPVDETVRTACWSEAEKLERYFDRITSCHVTVACDKKQQRGNHFAVHVRLAVPGGEIVVSRSAPEHAADEKAGLAIREAFDEVRRQLQDHARKQRGDVKRHAEPGRAPARGDARDAEQAGFVGPSHGDRLYRHAQPQPGERPSTGDAAG